MTELVDTNVLVRFYTRDHEDQFHQAVAWFKQAQDSKKKLLISTLVVAETCFVLESFYKQTRKAIADHLEVTISQKWLTVPERKVLIASLRLFAQGGHFVDCYLASKARIDNSKVLTFDKNLSKSV